MPIADDEEGIVGIHVFRREPNFRPMMEGPMVVQGNAAGQRKLSVFYF
jgi:hypothetical protein